MANANWKQFLNLWAFIPIHETGKYSYMNVTVNVTLFLAMGSVISLQFLQDLLKL